MGTNRWRIQYGNYMGSLFSISIELECSNQSKGQKSRSRLSILMYRPRDVDQLIIVKTSNNHIKHDAIEMPIIQQTEIIVHNTLTKSLGQFPILDNICTFSPLIFIKDQSYLMGCLYSNDIKCRYQDSSYFHETQLLEIIFKDLASRNKNGRITLETFLLYFHQKGYWGDFIYQKLGSKSGSDGLTKNDFVSGICQLCNQHKKQHIIYLFEFLKDDNEQGISYKSMLSIFYNFPNHRLILLLKQQMQNIVKRANQSQSNPEQSSTQQLEIVSEPSSAKRIASGYGFNQQMQAQQTIINKNLNSLVKKYVKMLFKQIGVNYLNQKIRSDKFEGIMDKHPSLYENYFEGFHEQIWTCKDNNDAMQCIPGYLKSNNLQKQSPVYLSKSNIGTKNHLQMLLVHCTLIITKPSTNQSIPLPKYIINLEGLNVFFSENSPFNIKINHRDEKYEEKTLYFDNQKIFNEWKELLTPFKGKSIHEDYIIGDQIGVGQFSTVYHGQNKYTHQKCAIKQIKNSGLDQQAKSRLLKETQIMRNFECTYLINHIETIQTRSETYIITELAETGVELNQFIIQRQGIITEKQAADIIKQLIFGTSIMHKKGFIHRDLKPSNIMVMEVKQKKEIEIRIIDFGLSLSLKECQFINHQMAYCSIGGTPGYMAPQVFGRGELTPKIDAYSIGAIIYYMFACEAPPSCLYFNSTVSFEGKRWQHVSGLAKNLISKLMELNYQERITLDEAIKHQWFKATSGNS